MATTQTSPIGKDAARRFARAIDLISHVPTTAEPVSTTPVERARTIASAAALRASAISGTLALPPGPAGLITVLPELVSVWMIQAQMVADIAGTFGRSATLSREHMLYCLFRHSAAQLVRDLVVRVGQRQVVRLASVRVVQSLTAKIGIRISQRAVRVSVARWLPVVGAIGIAGYAYYDTAQVAQTAVTMFENDFTTESSGAA